MADGYNRVMLLGNLGADPELRFTQAGQGVLNIRLATTESYLNKDQERVERTDWHSVVVWGKRAEALAKILTKGSSVFIEGSLRTSSYEKDGVKHYKVEVNATHISLVGSRGANEPDPPGYEDRSGGAAPSGGGAYATRAPAQSSAPSGGGATDGDFVVKFGRDKGKRISEVDDLSWLRGALERDLTDASKERFHGKARAQVASIDAEVARRNGGGAAPGGQLPADEYEVEGGGATGGDDDIPFSSCDMAADPMVVGPRSMLDRVFR